MPGTRVRTNKPKDKKTKNAREVRVSTDQAEVNALLAKGWELLHGCIAHVDDLGYNAKPHFILARVASD